MWRFRWKRLAFDQPGQNGGEDRDINNQTLPRFDLHRAKTTAVRCASQRLRNGNEREDPETQTCRADAPTARAFDDQPGCQADFADDQRSREPRRVLYAVGRCRWPEPFSECRRAKNRGQTRAHKNLAAPTT